MITTTALLFSSLSSRITFKTFSKHLYHNKLAEADYTSSISCSLKVCANAATVLGFLSSKTFIFELTSSFLGPAATLEPVFAHFDADFSLDIDI